MKNRTKHYSSSGICFVLLFLFVFSNLYSQKRNYIWCFGDSAGIDFNNLINPSNFTASLRTRGSCVSIADTGGSLLFYGNTVAGIAGNTGQIWNHNHQIMQNGDSLVGEGWYQEMVIVPKPDSSLLYYVFTNGVTGSSQNGLYYSMIDIGQNGGLGSVLQKNVFLSSVDLIDGLIAIKHGNGRDWWIIVHNWNNHNKFSKYLISPTDISTPILQSIGTNHNTDLGRFKFSVDGNKLLVVNYIGLVELFDFDRCTGNLSNPITISPETFSNSKKYFGFSFSPDGRFIYVSNTDDSINVVSQYDLLAANITASKIVVNQQVMWASGGQHLLGPDGKIYLTHYYEDGAFPYFDSVYNIYNMNLSVINSPDSLGLACDFQPFSFTFGGHRTYYGLPNNPDYDMGAWSGSPCDTLTGISVIVPLESKPQLFVYYHAAWQTAFVNAQNIQGNKSVLKVFDINGKVVFSSEKKTQPPYFTQDVNCAALAKGMYVVSLQTEKEKLVKKFVKE